MSRRADRLFKIVQYLRGRRLTTAAQLSEWLEVSERTIYRDVRDLSLNGTPIEGEPGVGYRLKTSLDLPPLMFDAKELEALHLAAKMVSAWGSPSLTQAAELALAKIRTVLPESLKIKAEYSPFCVPKFFDAVHASRLGLLREAIQSRTVVALTYTDQLQRHTQRIVWPLGLFFWGNVWTLAAYCELRREFRTFRLDRVLDMTVQSAVYPDTEGLRLNDYMQAMLADNPKEQSFCSAVL